jgi:hypothetical protein
MYKNNTKTLVNLRVVARFSFCVTGLKSTTPSAAILIRSVMDSANFEQSSNK